MSQQHEEDATDSLLRDLENRSSNSTSSVDDDDEDLEAFLASLEDDSPSPSRPVAVATKPKPTSTTLDIKEAPKAELQVSEPSKKEKSKEPKAEKTEKSKEPKAEKTESTRTAGEKVRIVGTVLKVLLVVGSTFGFWWLLGAYLAQWISAWWLILGLATLVVGIIPPVLRLAAKQRGKLSWWFAGVSTALLLLLIAPIPNQAASAIGSYGHWPATSVAQGASLAPDWVGVGIFNWASLNLASSLSTESTSPRALGGVLPLTEVPAAEETTPAQPEVPESEAPAPPVE